ncbi:MAG: hypothetical protein PHU85_20530 [Phycisphaerae bacterium]|nr:hypothetical protein [Phycisphaerae bacterium]
MRFSETHGIVYVLKPADYAAGGTGESINTELYSHVTFLVQCATMTDNGGAGADLTVKSGLTDGTQTTAETFHYRLADAVQAAAGADVYADEASATTLELLKATYDSKLLIVEVDVSEITVDQPWLTLALNNHGTAANLSVVAILGGPRYLAQHMPSALS